MKVGDLVMYKGKAGIVLGPCRKRWAKDGDWWVLWYHREKPIVENEGFLERVNEAEI